MNLEELPNIPESEYNLDYLNNGERQSILIHEYPCLDKTMDLPEPPQLIRFSYVALHLLKGLSPEKIIKMLEDRHSEGKVYEWVDWDLDYTANQVYHIAGRGNYKPLGCSNLKSMGLCIEDCPLNKCEWNFKPVNEMKK